MKKQYDYFPVINLGTSFCRFSCLTEKTQKRFFLVQQIITKSDNVILTLFYIFSMFRPSGMKMFTTKFLIARVVSRYTVEVESRIVALHVILLCNSVCKLSVKWYRPSLEHLYYRYS